MTLPVLNNINDVGPRFDIGIVSPTFGSAGFFIKPGTFDKKMQTQLRDEVVAAVTASIVDRDIALWKRISQVNWQKGKDEQVFTDGARFRDATSIDIHKQGQIRLVPKPTAEADTAAGAAVGRGAAFGPRSSSIALPGVAVFPWTLGNYIYSQNPNVGIPVWNVVAGAFLTSPITDIVTDFKNVYFAIGGNQIGFTTLEAPGAPAGYDTGGVQSKTQMYYDILRKNLYAITGDVSAQGAVQLLKINSGGAATVVFDWINGRVEGIDGYLGNIIVAWNAGDANRGSAGRSFLYKYDGTTVTEFAEMPDGTEVTSVFTYLGVLYVAAMETDQYTGAVIGALYAVTSSTLSRIGSTDLLSFFDINGSGFQFGGPSRMFGSGNYLYVPIGNILWVYDIVNGGLSRAFGSNDFNPGAILGDQITGALVVSGRIFSYHAHNSTVPLRGGIQRLNGNPAIAYTPTYAGEGQLTGSRMDAGLPYVNKFWYGWECVFKPLLVGDKIAIDYSLDDGATFTPCANSPLTAVGGETMLTFLTKKVNPHAMYRVTLTPANSDGGPIVVSIAAKYIVVNANASVYTMTITGYDSIRGRGNKVEDGSGADILDFMDNIARQNELVTFYEPDDATRTPHTCWVMSARRPVTDTSHTFDAKKKEGDVELVLWETT